MTDAKAISRTDDLQHIRVVGVGLVVLTVLVLITSISGAAAPV